MPKLPDQSITGFYIKREDPPLRKRNGRLSIYQPRIEKVKGLPAGWYLIGIVQSASGANSAASNLRIRFKDMEFTSCQADDHKTSKLYCRVKQINKIPKQA